MKKNSQVFRRRLITTDRLPVCEHFGADIVTLIITSPKRIVTVLTFLSLQICPAVFVHLLTISHLYRRLRTHLNLRGNTDSNRKFFQKLLMIYPSFSSKIKVGRVAMKI